VARTTDLVAETHGLLNNEVSDPSVLVVVNVGSLKKDVPWQKRREEARSRRKKVSSFDRWALEQLWQDVRRCLKEVERSRPRLSTSI
jgi:hypothetical protein